jgi:coniferyl-aldehyde dehydrogenase
MRRRYLGRTVSGGVTINDLLLHVATEDLPFGGVGESGMGYYHGRRGFETFSHSRGIVSAPRFSANRLMAPPYGKRIRKILDWMRRRELRAVGKRLPRLTKPPIQ